MAPRASWRGLPFRDTSRVIVEFCWPPERLLVAFWRHLVVPGWLWKLPVASGRFPWSCGGPLVAPGWLSFASGGPGWPLVGAGGARGRCTKPAHKLIQNARFAIHLSSGTRNLDKSMFFYRYPQGGVHFYCKFTYLLRIIHNEQLTRFVHDHSKRI